MNAESLRLSEDVSAKVALGLRELAESLRATLGDRLVSLLAFGSAVRGGWVDGRSDVDLVLVLRDPSRETLASIADTLGVARNALRFETMILAADELERSADVFPLLYDDIRGCHVVLAGKDPFAELPISDAHRRLRIEQELRDMKIRLRRLLVDSQGDPARLAGALERKLKQLRGPLHALLTLLGTAPKSDRWEAVLSAAGGAFELELEPLSSPRDDPSAAADALIALLARAIERVDRLHD